MMKMLPFKKMLVAAAVAGGFMAAPVAHSAALLNSILTVPGLNQIEDTNADRFIRADAAGNITLANGNTYRSLTGADTLQQGDILQSILQFTSLNGPQISANGAPFNAPSYGLVAYSELVVGTITTAAGIDSFNFSGTGNLLGGANALVDVYENGIGADINSLISLFSSTPAAGITEVINSSAVASFGLAEADDFWQGRTPTGTLNTLFTAPNGSGQFGAYEFGLTVLSNPGALPIVTNGIVTGAAGHAGTFHDVVGDGSAFPLSPGVNTGWDLSSNTNAQFLTKVPEPEVLAMLSMGLLAGSFMQRRRSK